MNLHRLCIFKETHHVPLRAYVCPRPKNSPLLLVRSKTTTALLCWSPWDYISPSGPGRGGMLGGRISHLFLCIVLLKKPSIVGLHAIQLCRNVLVYPRGATDVRCAICGTTTAAPPPANQVAHLNCVQCHPILMYPYGAPCVKYAICNYITNAGMHNMRFPIHVAHRPNEPTPVPPSTSFQSSRASNMTVVVKNPMSVNENGKLVSNVVVGVTTGKK